jgi:DNA primase
MSYSFPSSPSQLMIEATDSGKNSGSEPYRFISTDIEASGRSTKNGCDVSERSAAGACRTGAKLSGFATTGRLRREQGIARFAPSEIEFAKRLDLRLICQRLGFSISRSGSARCPFPDHRDSSPSFHIWHATNTWKCFGCGRRGSTIDLVMALLNLKFPAAILWLQGRSFAPMLQQHLINEPPDFENIAAGHFSYVEPHGELYKYLLQASPLQLSGKLYLGQRRFSDAALRHFEIGQIESSVELVRKMVRRWGYASVESAGLLTKASTEASPQLLFRNGYLVFPFIRQGVYDYLQARAIDDTHQGPRWIALRSISPPVYNIDALGHCGEASVLICEGITDTISAFEMKRAAIGLVSANYMIPKAVIDKLRGCTVYLVPDRDRAGRAMGSRLREQLSRYGISHVVQNLQLPFRDLNEQLRGTTPRDE